jgi:competence protein ComGC
MQNRLFKNNQPGISFIEILVLLLLISIFMSMAIPRFITNRPGMAQKNFFADFATLVSDTVYQAIVTKKVHQIFWDFDHHQIIVKRHELVSDEKNKHIQFKPLGKDVFHSQIKIPELFLVRNFIVQGNEQMESGVKKHDAWFYIMPDGSSQATTINIDDDTQDTPAKFSITINPFYSQASLHETFQK